MKITEVSHDFEDGYEVTDFVLKISINATAEKISNNVKMSFGCCNMQRCVAILSAHTNKQASK